MVPAVLDDIHLRVPLPTRYFGDGGPLTVEVGGRELRVQVPEGIVPGTMLRLLDSAGSLFPGRPGHILLQLELHLEERKVQDFQAALSLDRAEAANGTIREIFLGERKVRVRIPAGVFEGQHIRLKGAASYIDPHLIGDVYLIVDIEQTAWDLLGDAVSWVSALTPDEVELAVPIPIFVKASLTWKLKKTTVRVSFGG